MNIVFHEQTKTFHLFNSNISYIMTVLPNGHMGQLYFGKRIHDQEDFSHLLEICYHPVASCVFPCDLAFSLEHIKQEYPVYGTSDYRHPAIEILQKNGSRISDFQYITHRIERGKPKLEGLPATYTETPDEAMTLTILLKDPLTKISLELLYSIFSEGGILTRSARILNQGSETVHITKAFSLCMDLPDDNYQWIQLSGSWSRERHIKLRKLEQGIQAVDSMRGNSSSVQNPFIALKRPSADEFQGEVLGFSLIYSGNFMAQAEVDTYNVTRILLGIHPECFDWKLNPSHSFQTPESVMIYSDQGINGMSQTFHHLFQKHLVRGKWRDKARPILINNWEVTYFDFTEDILVQIASEAQKCGIEVFVLDDGWFGKRENDSAGLGDWYANTSRLPHGISGLSERIEALGMKFGLWIEPEMVNKDSNLYRAHPDWLIEVPGRRSCHGRNQYVLDFSRKEIVDHIYQMLSDIFSNAKVSYVKWDMNRSITECYSRALPPEQQGEVFHRYILGVYNLYERLTTAFPHILFESCASGGARFDPGMLYYAPQAWASDNSDAIERLKIQYGTSMCYPLSCIGSHVSTVPNHQVFRNTPLDTRGNVACFGTFGYELNLQLLSDQELNEVKRQVSFMKEYRELIQFGTFYRLASPFEGNITCWMCVSQDQKQAIVGWYRLLSSVNQPYSRITLHGLNPDYHYSLIGTDQKFYGDELMNLGMITSDETCGYEAAGSRYAHDFASRIFIFQAD